MQNSGLSYNNKNNYVVVGNAIDVDSEREN